MLEKVDSRSGSTSLKWDGRWLSSSVDPRTEAKKWVNSQKLKAKSKSITIVLGLGAGYHVSELRKQHQTKKILVIETKKEVLQRVQSYMSLDLVGIEFEIISCANEIFRSAKIQKAVSAQYEVLSFSPALQTDPTLFATIKENLNFRTSLSMKWLKVLRPDFSEIIDFDRLHGDSPDKPLINLGDLIKYNMNVGQPNRTQIVLNILKELIK